MKLLIDRKSAVSIRRQIVEQVVFGVATGQLEPGTALPSVRELAIRHKIHANTVSQAYQELVDRHFIKRQRGKRMVVRAPEESVVPHEEDLDDFIDAAIREARSKGYTMQELRERVRSRLLAEPPDHVLSVAKDRATAELLRTELTRELQVDVEASELDDLARSPGSAIGALVACLPGLVWEVAPILGRRPTVVPLEPSGAGPLMDRMRQLTQPSVIVLASVSPYVLQIAEGVLAPVAGTRHTIEQFCLSDGERRNFSGADLVVTDSVTDSQVQAPNVFRYSLVSASALERIREIIPDLKRTPPRNR